LSFSLSLLAFTALTITAPVAFKNDRGCHRRCNRTSVCHVNIDFIDKVGVAWVVKNWLEEVIVLALQLHPSHLLAFVVLVQASCRSGWHSQCQQRQNALWARTAHCATECMMDDGSDEYDESGVHEKVGPHDRRGEVAKYSDLKPKLQIEVNSASSNLPRPSFFLP
jgi:hypothetical protein